jgi:hypothetical protein
MQLKVVKADGSQELYLHTKVLGTIANALAGCGQDSGFIAEQLCEAITFYLYNTYTDGTVASSEIYFMIQAMLGATGYEDASIVLNNYHFSRQLTRRRIEVLRASGQAYSWNKSCISNELVKNEVCDLHTARVIASSVEEKVLRLGMLKIPTRLVKELVYIETQAMLTAQAQLALPQQLKYPRQSGLEDMEVMREQLAHNGLCAVEV